MKERVNPRQFALDIIEKLPEGATLEHLRDQFDLILAILESYRDEEEGRVISHAEMMAELQKWISKSAGRPEPART